jgi:hypothetical protein
VLALLCAAIKDFMRLMFHPSRAAKLFWSLICQAKAPHRPKAAGPSGQLVHGELGLYDVIRHYGLNMGLVLAAAQLAVPKVSMSQALRSVFYAAAIGMHIHPQDGLIHGDAVTLQRQLTSINCAFGLEGAANVLNHGPQGGLQRRKLWAGLHTGQETGRATLTAALADWRAASLVRRGARRQLQRCGQVRLLWPARRRRRDALLCLAGVCAR